VVVDALLAAVAAPANAGFGGTLSGSPCSRCGVAIQGLAVLARQHQPMVGWDVTGAVVVDQAEQVRVQG
jgi:hypothetical protein